jgi:hypothetical protein
MRIETNAKNVPKHAEQNSAKGVILLFGEREKLRQFCAKEPLPQMRKFAFTCALILLLCCFA